jgi:hypothetical protein
MMEILRYHFYYLKYFEYEKILKERSIFNTKMNQRVVCVDAKIFKKSISKKLNFLIYFISSKMEKRPI